MPETADASTRFGAVKARLEWSGMLIDDFDIAVAAIALDHGCAVLTANLEHFQRIAEIESTHWK